LPTHLPFPTRRPSDLAPRIAAAESAEPAAGIAATESTTRVAASAASAQHIAEQHSRQEATSAAPENRPQDDNPENDQRPGNRLLRLRPHAAPQRRIERDPFGLRNAQPDGGSRGPQRFAVLILPQRRTHGAQNVAIEAIRKQRFQTVAYFQPVAPVAHRQQQQY